MRILVLDDDPERHAAFARRLRGHHAHHVTKALAAIVLLRGPRYDLVFLDHDLGEDRSNRRPDGSYWNGADVARAIARLPRKSMPGQVIIHSWNPIGAANIASILYDAGVPFLREPFSSV